MSLDEMHAQDGSVRRPYAGVAEWLGTVSSEQLEHRRVEAELFYRRGGITFAVYGDNQGEERIIPYDIIPRILSTQEWAKLSKGLEQRVKALNAYLADIYGKQEILKAGIVAPDLIWRNPAFRPEMCGIAVRMGSMSTSPGSTWCGSTATISTCSRTMRARRAASPTCWAGGRSPSA